MSFDLADLIRSIVIGQAVAMTILTVTYTLLSILWRGLRPGAMMGLISSGVSQVCASCFIVLIMIERINTQPMCSKTWLAVTYVLAGNLGMSLMSAHIVLYHAPFREKVMNWFGHLNTHNS